MAEFTAPRVTRKVIAMKPEVTAGVDVFAGTYAAGDVLPTIADTVRFTQNPNEIENLMLSGNMGRGPSILGATTARVDFSMFWRGRGSAYASGTRPHTDLPLRGSGHSSTVDTTGGAEKVTYQPTATDELMTIYIVDDIPGGNARSIQLVGCLGTFSLAARAGGNMRFDFSFLGSIEEIVDITYTSGTLSLTPAYPTLKSAAFQIGSTNYAPRIANVGFSMGAVVNYLESINAVSGVAGTKIFDRNPRLTIDPEGDREANSGWWAALRDGGPLKDCTFQLGTTQYNRLKFNFGAGGASQLQVVAQGMGSRDGVVTLPTTLLATIASGNDDYTLVAD